MPQVQQISSFEKDVQYISDTLIMQHHMGLGDHIHLVGLVRYAVLELGFENVVLFCKSRNYETVKRLYVNDPKIQIISIVNPVNANAEVDFALKFILRMPNDCVYFRLGYERYPWAQGGTIGYPSYVFYDMARVKRDIRWSYFNFDRNNEVQERIFKKLNPNNEPYIFIHDDPARGFNIPTSRALEVSNNSSDILVIRNDMTENILDFSLILERASELHCMGSSIFCFADLLSLGDKKCYFHDIRKPSIFVTDNILEADTKHSWIKVNQL